MCSAFVVDLLNFSFWPDDSVSADGRRVASTAYAVERGGARQVGYYALCAALDRALKVFSLHSVLTWLQCPHTAFYTHHFARHRVSHHMASHIASPLLSHLFSGRWRAVSFSRMDEPRDGWRGRARPALRLERLYPTARRTRARPEPRRLRAARCSWRVLSSHTYTYSYTLCNNVHCCIRAFILVPLLDVSLPFFRNSAGSSWTACAPRTAARWRCLSSLSSTSRAFATNTTGLRSRRVACASWSARRSSWQMCGAASRASRTQSRRTSRSCERSCNSRTFMSWPASPTIASRRHILYHMTLNLNIIWLNCKHSIFLFSNYNNKNIIIIITYCELNLLRRRSPSSASCVIPMASRSDFARVHYLCYVMLEFNVHVWYTRLISHMSTGIHNRSRANPRGQSGRARAARLYDRRDRAAVRRGERSSCRRLEDRERSEVVCSHRVARTARLFHVALQTWARRWHWERSSLSSHPHYLLLTISDSRA